MKFINLFSRRKLITDKTKIYERIREIVSPSFSLELPEHEVTEKLLKNMFPDEEGFLIANAFKKAIRPITARRIRKRTGFPKEKVQALLEDMVYTGKLIKRGLFYLILPYLPGGFEFYFTTNRDNPEYMKKVAEAHRELFDLGYPLKLSEVSPTIYRVIPSKEPIERAIDINKSMDVNHQILTFEVLKEYLADKKDFAVVPCSCRNAAKLAGHPCERTDENFCITAGFLARDVIKQGVGREVNLEELIEVMKRAEKEGLVHQTINIQKASVFICNCCPCCCGFLKSVKELDNYGAITKSNFDPVIDQEVCSLCKNCIEICPMGALSVSESDSIEDNGQVHFNLDKCIGCGLCASNCPQEAISLEKVRDIVPQKSMLGYMRKFEKIK